MKWPRHPGKERLSVVEAIAGEDADSEVEVVNTQYLMGAGITLNSVNKRRAAAFKRVSDVEGQSKKICRIDWKG